MKRDMNLVRDLLLRIEATTPVVSPAPIVILADTLVQPGEDRKNIEYHMHLLVDAGFAVPFRIGVSQLGQGIAALTWKGHHFLDSVRDDEIWRETKEGASKAGGFTVELLADLAKGFIKTQIKSYTGIQL